MTKARKTFTSTEPVKSEPVDVQDRIRAFFAKGGKVQQIPDGVGADTIKSRRDMNERSTQHALGGRRGAPRKKRELVEQEECSDD